MLAATRKKVAANARPGGPAVSDTTGPKAATMKAAHRRSSPAPRPKALAVSANEPIARGPCGQAACAFERQAGRKARGPPRGAKAAFAGPGEHPSREARRRGKKKKAPPPRSKSSCGGPRAIACGQG